MDIYNLTTVTQFILIVLSDLPEVCYPLFVVFATIYQVTLVGNGAILLAIATEKKLHTPMYFFLVNLFLLDILCPSATIPKMLENLLTEQQNISFLGCAFQLYFLVSLVGTEVFLLTLLAYDRCVAICFPLCYMLVMTKFHCIQLTAATWAAGFLKSLLHTVSTFPLSFCKSNRVNQYYCDIPQTMALSCSSAYVAEMLVLVVGGILGISAFLYLYLLHLHQIHPSKDPVSGREAQSLLHMCFPPPSVLSVLWHSNIYLHLAFLQPTLSSQRQTHLHAIWGYYPNVKPLDLQPENVEVK
uniref:Olfactory receptor n=1 Tax=Ailuropoda melanoleuca TaxID=9646 RepID=A0A7N5KLD9_AILME